MAVKQVGAAPTLPTHASTKGYVDLAMLYSALAANVINANATANTIADVTGLSFPVVAGQTSYFRFFIPYSAAATTTGSRWSINGPAVTSLVYTSEYTLTASTQTNNEGLAGYNLPAAASASSGSLPANFAVLEGIINPSASGIVIARFASSVASSAITALAGSLVSYRRML